MATKVVIKNQTLTSFGGIFYISDEYRRLFFRMIDRSLGQRSKSVGYQYSEIFSALTMVYFCSGDHLEDITRLGYDLRLCPDSRIPSPDTIARGLKELAEENIVHTSDSGNSYAYNACERVNGLLLDMLFRSGQLTGGQAVTLDFDHQFIEAEKYDTQYSYKKARGYFPGVATVGGLIVGVENRDGNANVRFRQAETLQRIFNRLEERSITVAHFRADCGSFSEDIVRTVFGHALHFYIRASNCRSRLAEFESYQGWKDVEINHVKMQVASFMFKEFMEDSHLRLVVQRTEVKPEEGEMDLFGKRYVYRAVLTDDWEKSEEEVIRFYNARGSSERNFDIQNNDFGWKHLPFSFMKENAVFLLVTAMAKNFFLYLVEKLSRKGVGGITPTSRMKRFLFAFVIVPAKWVKSGRRWLLNLYTEKPYHQYWDT